MTTPSLRNDGALVWPWMEWKSYKSLQWLNHTTRTWVVWTKVSANKCSKMCITYMTKYLTSADQMVLYYGFAHRSIKWWKRFFPHILDTAIVNAHILYNASSDKKLTQLEFRRAVAVGLLEGYESSKVRHRAQDPSLPL